MGEVQLLPLSVLLSIFFLAFFSSKNVELGAGSQTPCADCPKAFHLNNVLEMVNQTQPQPSPPLPTTSNTSLPPDYVYFNFLLQWPPSICTQEHTHCYGFNVLRRFTIRGLWPANRDGVTLQNCNPDDKLDWSKMADLEDELSTKWPTLSNSSTLQAFLSYQWSRYGTCSGATQLEYFQLALYVYDYIDLDHKLRAINVVPGTTKYNPATVIKDFETKYKIQISCIFCAMKSRSPLVEMIGAFEFPVGIDVQIGKSNVCRTKAVEFPP